jgi:ubiquitin C
MYILIQFQNFKTFHINISPFETVYEIKSKINSIEKIPINNQNLFYFGKLLENSKNISFYSIENNSLIHLIEQTKGGIEIFIHNSNGTTINLDVEPTETIESIKNKIFIKENIPLNNQELIIKGEKMENEKKLDEYNLDSEISLFNIENENNKKNIFIRILKFFNIFEWCLLLFSYIIIIVFFFVFKNNNYLNLIGAIIGVSATLFAG